MSILAFLVAAVTLISAQAGPKVQVGLYYESMCPFCAEYFLNQLKPTSELLTKYMETHLVPYGNTGTFRRGGQVTFICQHGTNECLLNKIHACALARMSEKSNLQQVLMASCLFENIYDITGIGAKCCSKFGLNWSDVSKCANGIEGTTLLDEYGNETERIKHHIQWDGVPTVTINGHEPAWGPLKPIVCETLAEEGVTPDACQQ